MIKEKKIVLKDNFIDLLLLCKKQVMVLVLLFASLCLNAQSIPATNGRPPCSDCAPTGWFDNGGTPDVSNRDKAATTGTTGGGSNWVNQLPLPPNNHVSWLSLRDLGSGGTEESVRTTVTGLTDGEVYEIVVYSLTQVTDASGGSSNFNDRYYSGILNDKFRFTVDGGDSKDVILTEAAGVWGTTKLRFVATGTTDVIRVFPGANSSYTGLVSNGGNGLINAESVQISVTVNAVNAAPVADDNNDTTVEGVATTFNVVSTDSDVDGNVVDSTVDLDTATPGIQNTYTTKQGTWSVNNSGDVTFTPEVGYVGTAMINYTVNDDYSLDGHSVPATSDPATLSVMVLLDSDKDGIPDSVDQDDDNDGILDVAEDECGVDADLIWNGTDTYGQNFTVSDLQGSGIDAVFTTVANSGASVPSSSGVYIADGLRLQADWEDLAVTDPNENVVFNFYFNQEVKLKNLNIKDIDRGNAFIDAVKVIAKDGKGNVVFLNITKGSDLSIDNNGFYYTTIDENSGDSDPTHWLTVNSNGFKIQSLQIIASPSVGDINGVVPTSPSRFVLGDLDLCTALDTDNDGTPNYLDLDSDGDGCSDAIEAGTTDIQTSYYQFPSNDVDLITGVPNSADPSNTSGNFTNSSVESCDCPNASGIDSDGDGVDDVCDQDYDNDGILNSDENSCTSSLSQSWTNTADTANGSSGSTNISFSVVNDANTGVFFTPTGTFNTTNFWSNPSVAGAPSLEFTSTWDLVPDRPSSFPASTDAGTSIVTITFSEKVYNPIIHIDRLGGNGESIKDQFFSNSAEFKLITPNVGLKRLSGNNQFQVNGKKIYRSPDVPLGLANPGGDSGSDFTKTAAGSVQFLGSFSSLSFEVTGIGVEGLNGRDGIEMIFELCPPTDTDNDGTPNYLDLDSDNDGCPDALEGSATNINYSDLVNGAINASVNDNGIPIFTNVGTSGNGITGQNDVSSTNSAVQSDECMPCNNTSELFKDNDLDGVGDDCDLDDDNDGILDSVEENLEEICLNLSGISNASPNFTGRTIAHSTGYTVTYNGTLSDENYSFGNAQNHTGTPLGNNSGDIRLGVITDNPASVTKRNFEEYTITFNKPVKLKISNKNNITGNFDGADYWDIKANTSTFTVNDSGTPDLENVVNNGSRITFDAIQGGTGAWEITSDDYITSVTLKMSTISNANNLSPIRLCAFVPQDTDSDGTPNHLDTDSDDDGCPDAVEAAGNIIPSQLTTLPGGSPTVNSSSDNLGVNSNKNGIPLPFGSTDGTETTGQNTTTAVTDANDSKACTADLRLTKTVNNALPKVGDNITYTLTVFNDGPLDATGVIVTDVLPGGLSYVSDSAGSTSYSGGIWSIGNLSSGDNIKLTITAKINMSGKIVNFAQIKDSDQLDIDSTPLDK